MKRGPFLRNLLFCKISWNQFTTYLTLQEKAGNKDHKIKNRIESWLKDAEEDAEKAEMYLDKKRERGNNKGDNTSSDTTKIVPKTDVLKAMETVEVASGERDKRKKTPPGPGDDRKRLIRELGRKPSEEKVSLYVRKPSEEENGNNNSANNAGSKSKQFMDNMARRSMEVPTEFLNTIQEEKPDANKPSTGQQIAKKYPFNRYVLTT